MYQARYWHEREFETVEKIREVAEQAGTPLATQSVAWILSNPVITSVILGASHTEQLTATLNASDYTLESAVKAKLD
jgi:1-deoxyxylulose-5-phosphate synthase